MRYWTRRCALALILVPALAGCGSHEQVASASGAGSAIAASGPAADYPMVIGDPYRVGARLYTPADVMNAWMNSSGHRANILNCGLKDLGVGLAYQGKTPIWTQDFGSQR